MTQTLTRWTAGILWLLALQTFVFGLSARRCGCGREVWAERLFMSAAALIAVACFILICQIRIEISAGDRPWWRTATFLSVRFQLACCAVGALIGYILAYGAGWLSHGRGGFLLYETAGICLLGVLFSVIEIAAVDWVRWRGGDLMHGSPDFIGADAWCERRLGVWWVVRLAPSVLIALLGLWMEKPFAFFYPASMLGWRAYLSVAHAMNWNFPGKDKIREGFAKRKTLEASPEFQQLHSRNGWIDTWSAILCLPSMAIPLGLWYLFGTYEFYDLNWVWLVCLAFGLMMTIPCVFIYLTTATKNYGRLAEFEHYARLKYGFGYRFWPLFGAFGALTVVSVIGVAFTAHFPT